MPNIDTKSLNYISYGLYVVTCNDGIKNNGLIVNTVTQVANNPTKIAVTICKENYSHDVIKQTNRLNINTLTTKTPFSIFEHFGFCSGKNTDKFESFPYFPSDNGLPVLVDYINSYISLKITQYIDLGTHGMFIGEISEANVINNDESITYACYHKNVKPKPETLNQTKGFMCTICGYVHEAEALPEDFVCPLCKHGAADFIEL